MLLLFPSQGGVVIEDCDQDLRRRVKIAGDYDAGECGLDIYNLVEADSGTWQCEVRRDIETNTLSDFPPRWRSTSSVTGALERR